MSGWLSWFSFWDNLVLRWEIFSGLMVLAFTVYFCFQMDLFKKK
jgi:hypothetical protein